MNLVENKKVSIVVPVYKCEPYIGKCIESLQNQSHKNLEIILVDDGSPDKSGEICDAYAKKDPRIIVIHQDNQGVSMARNKALQEVSGDYITFVDSDDYIDPNLVRICLQEIQEKDVDVVIYNVSTIENGKIHHHSMDPKFYTDRDTCYRAIIRDDIPCYLCNKFFKAHIWEGIKLSPNTMFEDLHIMPQVFHAIKSISYIDKDLYYYNCDNDNSITSNWSSKNKYGLYASFKTRQTYAKDMHMDDFVSYCRHRAIRSAVGGIGFDLARPELEQWQLDDMYDYLRKEEKAKDRPKIGLKYEFLLWSALHAPTLSKLYGKSMFLLEKLKK